MTIASTQFTPSLDTCALSPVANALLSVPDTVKLMSLVIKSLSLSPVSSLIAVIPITAVGALLSITTSWLALEPTLPAASTTRAV